MLCTRSASDWVRELSALGVPAGPVLSVPEVLSAPQIRDRDVLARYGDLELLAAPVVVNGTRPKAATPPPELGKDNARIYGALGLSEETLRQLEKEGVI